MKPPKGIVVRLPINDHAVTSRLAEAARTYAMKEAPKASGHLASGIFTMFGPDYYGLSWEADYGWYQESGINPFTMDHMQGKTIPMWVTDPDEKDLRNPKAQTRMREDGRMEVLIFRKVAAKGQRRKDGSLASFPGRPGKIKPHGADGRVQRFNTGVQWRHPGIKPGNFIASGIRRAAIANGINPTRLALELVR